MNKYIGIFLISLVGIISAANAQFKPGDIGFNPNTYDIYKKAGVKTCTEFQIDTSYGYYETQSAFSEYTEQGWLYRTTYSENLEESYDEEESETWNDTIKDEYTYFPDGRIRIITLFGYDSYPIEYAFEYDKKNKLIYGSVAAAEARKYSYEYDKQGNIIKRMGKSNEFQYDDEGNLMDEMVWVDREHSTYTWDDHHQLLSESFYVYDELYYKIDYTYNQTGQLTEYKVYYDPSPGEAPAYTNKLMYNEKCLLIKMITIHEDLNMEYKYVYTFY